MEWDYKIENIGSYASKVTEDRLRQLGSQDGGSWELVNVLQNGTAFFKKPLITHPSVSVNISTEIVPEIKPATPVPTPSTRRKTK